MKAVEDLQAKLNALMEELDFKVFRPAQVTPLLPPPPPRANPLVSSVHSCVLYASIFSWPPPFERVESR